MIKIDVSSFWKEVVFFIIILFIFVDKFVKCGILIII